MRRKFFLASVLSMVVAGAHAGEWVNLGTTSNTVADHICDVVISPGGYPDIDCPAGNPEITASGVISATGISVTGAISTTSLFVNGTEITGSGGGGDDDIQVVDFAQRDALSPVVGDVVYNTDVNRLEWWNGSGWYYSDGPPTESIDYYQSCQAILDDGASTGDGVYTIDPDDDYANAFDVYCDMTTDGGGWIRLTLSDALSEFDSNYDSIFEQGRDSNDMLKCSGDEFQHTNATTSSTYNHDHHHGNGGSNLLTDIFYINDATGSNFTNEQLNQIRSLISQLSDTTEMVTASCDDDNYSGNHNIYLYDDSLGSGTSFHVTPYVSGDNTYSYAVFGMNGQTGNDSPLPDLPASHILPVSILMDGGCCGAEGGGSYWGYEESYILVK